MLFKGNWHKKFLHERGHTVYQNYFANEDKGFGCGYGRNMHFCIGVFVPLFWKPCFEIGTQTLTFSTKALAHLSLLQ